MSFWGLSLHINLRSGKLHKDLVMVLLFLRYMLALAFLLGGNAQLFLLTSRYPEYMERAQGGVLLLCYLIAMGHGNQNNETSWVALQVLA